MQFGMIGFWAKWEEGIVGIAKLVRGWLRKQEVLFTNDVFLPEDFNA